MIQQRMVKEKKLYSVWLFVFYTIIKDLLNLNFVLRGSSNIKSSNKTNGKSFEGEILYGIKIAVLGIENNLT